MYLLTVFEWQVQTDKVFFDISGSREEHDLISKKIRMSEKIIRMSEKIIGINEKIIRINEKQNQ